MRTDCVDHDVDRIITTDETGVLRPQIPGHRVQSPQRRKVGPQSLGADLEQLDRGRQVTQGPQPQVDEYDIVDEARRRRRAQDLAAMPCGHHPRRRVQRRPEVVVAAEFGHARSDSHPDRQRQRPLRFNRGLHGRTSRFEGGADAVTGVFEQPAAPGLDSISQQLIMGGQFHKHCVRIGLPSFRRPLDVGEQERHRL